MLKFLVIIGAIFLIIMMIRARFASLQKGGTPKKTRPSWTNQEAIKRFIIEFISVAILLFIIGFFLTHPRIIMSLIKLFQIILSSFSHHNATCITSSGDPC